MKTKLFSEDRLVYRKQATVEAGAEAAETRAEQNAVKFLAAVNEKQHIEGGDRPESILENNPYKDALLAFAEDLDDEAYKFTDVEYRPGKLILKYATNEVTVTGPLYYAIFWPEIQKILEHAFSGKSIPMSDLKNAIRLNRALKLENLIGEIAKNRDVTKIDVRLIEAAEQELKSPELQAEIRREAASGLAKARRTFEREKVKERVESNVHQELDQAFGVAPSQTEVNEQRIDQWVLTVSRDYKKINAHNWNPTNKTGLDEIRNEWIHVGIPAEVGSPFYDKIFKQLSKTFDTAFLNTKPDHIKNWYMNPREHLNELQNYDNGFYRSWKFHESVRDFMVQQDVFQKTSKDRIEDLDRDPIAVKITDGVKKNLEQFKQAIKERDYATAGMYALGIWAIYKSVQKLSEASGGKATKWLIYGAAAYTGHIFLKNAGYDILKKLNLKDMEAEVMGTPLEGLARLQIPEAESIDYAVYMRTSELKISSLYNLYQQTHHAADEKAEGFIDPAQFPNEFPEFKNNIPLDKDKNKEYARVGHELYMVIHCLRLAYEKTLMLDEGLPEYYGKSFEQALQHPVLKDSKVRHFTGILMKYTPAKFEKSIFEPEAVRNARKRFTEVFAKTDMGANLDTLPLDTENHILGGKVMNFPIVVIIDPTKKSYRIYAKKDYNEKKGQIHEAHALGEIPLKGAADRNIEDLKSAITQRMLLMIEPIQSSGGRILSKPQYSRGKWQGKVEIPGAQKYHIDPKPATFEVIPREDGGISLKIEGTPVSVNVDYFMDQEFLHAGVLLTRMASNEKLAALIPFYNTGRIRFIRELPARGENFPFQIELVGETVTVTYNATAREFIIEEDDQLKLLKNAQFRREYVNALGEDPQLNDVFKKLAEIVDDAPEQFHLYLFEGGKKWFTNATWDSPLRGVGLDLVSGSVPDYYANGVLAAKKQSLLYTLEAHIENAATFDDINKAETEVLSDAIAELNVLADRLVRESDRLRRKGEKWERDKFFTDIIQPLQRAGIKSRTYASAAEELEASAMAQFGLDGSDVFKQPHRVLAHLKGVYAFYTGHLDGEELDRVKYPRPQSTNPETDPVLDPYYRIGYLKYVKDEVLRQAVQFGEPLPTPEAWKIMDYKSWKISGQAIIEPLDPIDEKGPMDHDVNASRQTPEKLTELERYYAKKMKELIEKVKQINHPLGRANPDALDLYLKQFIKGDGTTSELIEECATIDTLYGARRSMQIKAVEERIELQKLYILQKDDFWVDISVLDRLKIWKHKLFQ